MEVYTIEDATVLIPNKEHKNFTQTKTFIPKGTTLIGEPKVFVGERKGEPFKYRLFATQDQKLIYLNKIKPTNMQRTEVTLGADGTAKPISVNIPKPLADRNALYGLVIGAVAGFGYSAHKDKTAKQKLMFTIGGALAGFAIGKIITKKRAITVSK